MSYRVLDDFRIEKEVPAELIHAYQDRLPEQIIQIWKEYGFGSFMDGFMKVVNPEEFQDILQRAYFMGSKSVPVFVTALGDMIVWEEGSYLTILRFRHGAFSVMERGCSYFLDDLMDAEYEEEFLKPHDYYIALSKQGPVGYDECFGYVPLLCMGGPEVVGHLKKAKILEHMELILEAGGPMG